MKKVTTILMLLVLTCAGAWAQTDDRWPINFPKDQTFTRTDRHINSVSFNDQTIDGLYVNQSTLCYQDLTATKTVKLPVSTTIKPSFNVAGGWQHGFVYIDLNNDGDFTDEGELVAKSPTEGSPNLATAIAEFTSPATEGTYRMRVKTDWASEDPGGNPGTMESGELKNYIIDNGGQIVDLTLQIIATTPEQEAAYAKIGEWLPLMQESMALVTDASNYISNAIQSGEGSYAALLDKNNATYFHSAWSGSMVNVPGHDLQARLPEAVNAFHLFYVTRSTGTGYPTGFRIDGSNNADDFSEAGGTGWTNEVASLSSLPSGATKSYLSDKITLSGSYQYLRFVPTIGNNQGANWFCLAEFWLLPSNETVDAAINLMKNVNSVFDITNEMVATINQIDTDLRSTVTKVTYVVKDEDGNTLFTSEPQDVAKGTTITTLPTEFQHPLFYEYDEISVSISSETTVEFTATLKENAPFEFTADTSAPVWYNLTLSATPNYVTYVADGAQNVQLPTTLTDDETTQWAFIGNPYAGFEIVNKAAGTDLVLGSGATKGSANTGRDVYATLQSKGSQYPNEVWTAVASNSINGKNGFYLKNTEGDALNKRNQTANISYWVGGADSGSTFVATKVLTDEEKYNELIALLESYPFGTSTNQYSLTLEGADQTENAMNLLQNLKDAGYSEDNKAELDKIVAGMSLNLPKAGFYRIKGNTSGKYLAAGSASNGKYNMTDAVDATTIFCFDGTKLINYSNGMVNGMSASSWAWVYGDGAASEVTFQDGLTKGGYGIKSNNANFYDNGDGSASADRGGNVTINENTNSRYTSWYLEEVKELPVTLHESETKEGYSVWIATFSAPVSVVSVEGAEIHKVSDTGSAFFCEPANVQGIPAGKGALLVTDTETATATVTLGETSEDFETILQPLYACEKGKAGLFFGKVEGSEIAGLYPIDSETLTGGFKAFVDDSTGEGKEMIFTNESNGVDAIDNGQLNIENGAVYNLQGQKVNKAQKGVFIQNGKKVVVK